MGAQDDNPTVPPAAPRRTPSRLDGLTFDEDLLDLLADRLADRLASRLELATKPREALVNADEVARMMGRKRSWVYDHAGDLGAVRLGPGSRPRLGFYPARVTEYLQSVANPPPISLPKPAPRRRQPRPGHTATGVKLLTVRGPSYKTQPPTPDLPGSSEPKTAP